MGKLSRDKIREIKELLDRDGELSAEWKELLFPCEEGSTAEHCRELLFNVDDDILVLDADHRVVDFNGETLSTSGEPREAVLGRRCHEVLLGRTEPCHEPGGDCHIDSVLRTGETTSCRHVVENDDGSSRHVHVRLSPLKSKGKQVTNVVVACRDVTELVRAQAASVRSERRYRELFDRVRNAVVVYTPADDGENFEITDFNLAASRIEGVKREDVVGRLVTEAFPGVEEFGLLEVIRKVHRTGEPANHPIRFYKDKRITGWRENWVYKLPSGELVAVYDDLTEQKKFEQELSASEARFHALFTTMQEGVVLHEMVYDVDGNAIDYRILDVNEAFESLTGLRRRDVAGGLASKVYGSGEPPYFDIYEKVARTGQPTSFDSYFPPMDKHFFISVFAPERDHFATVFFDITDIKKSQKALAESEGKYRTLVEMFPHTIIIIQDGKFAFVNQATLDLMGLEDEDEMIGEDILPLVVEKDRERIGTYMADRLAGRSDVPWHYELQIVRANGEPADLEVFVEKIAYQGKPAIQAMAMDITQRKLADEERRNLEAQMMQTQKLESLGVLAGGIAHDFNNLLMGILGHADLALMELPPSSPSSSSIGEIEKAARQAAELCKQMLAYSGKGRFVTERLSLQQIVEDIAHLLKVSISKRSILKFDFAPELPPIEADPSQIRQVVMNLIVNASEALGEKSGIISVVSGLMECDEEYLTDVFLASELKEGVYVFLEVSDTGCGMDKETSRKIFDPFFTTKFTGRGLGLAAVLGIVRSHNGAIQVYSEPDRGTTFKVLFPAVLDGATPQPVAEPITDVFRGQGTVLVVDDEPSARTVTKLFLEKAGFDTLLARDGEEAVQVFKDHSDEITAVVLDLTMPRMGGEATFRELRRIRADVKVLLSSGYNELEVTQRFIGKGLAGFIQKPYKFSVLMKKLKEIL